MQQYNLFDNLFNRSLTFQIKAGGATRLETGSLSGGCSDLHPARRYDGMMQTPGFTVREGDTWRLGADLKVGLRQGRRGRSTAGARRTRCALSPSRRTA